MAKRISLLFIGVLVILSVAPFVAAQDDRPTIGFLPGVVDPFYEAMQVGVEKAAADLGLEVVTQIPPDWGVEVQVPILDAMVARGDLEYLITAPTDREQLVGPLQAALDAGIKIITVDTFLGDGDYISGPVTFPLTFIGSDNVEGGRIAGRALAEALGGEGKVYIQNTNHGVSSVEARSQGFREVIAEFPNMEIVGEEWCEDDAGIAAEQTSAVLQREPDLAGIFGVNVFSYEGAGNALLAAGLGGQVQLVAYDATDFAIEQLRAGTVTLVIAQVPHDMGYLSVEFALADWRGVTSIPKHVTTGFGVIDAENVDDPLFSRFIYSQAG
jgi:ribose transport system substrate-binding protein